MWRFGVLVLASLTIHGSDGWFFSNNRLPKWGSLRVTWGINPFTNFNSLPRTVADALRSGFVRISQCDSSAAWRGSRYVKDGDRAVTLLYDRRGYIAGIQQGIPKGLPNGYPKAALRPPFQEDGDYYVSTAYFVNPSIICTTGRTSRQFRAQGTGNALYIQNGTNPETDSLQIPVRETGVSGTNWVQGKCFRTMGQHYWYNAHANTSCDSLFPVFLLYNGGWLNAFGWANIANLTSNRYEHPNPSVFSRFINDVPTCLYSAGTLSTMHIYFTSPFLDFC